MMGLNCSQDQTPYLTYLSLPPPSMNSIREVGILELWVLVQVWRWLDYPTNCLFLANSLSSWASLLTNKLKSSNHHLGPGLGAAAWFFAWAKSTIAMFPELVSNNPYNPIWSFNYRVKLELSRIWSHSFGIWYNGMFWWIEFLNVQGQRINNYWIQCRRTWLY